jgi:hypothetical protein
MDPHGTATEAAALEPEVPAMEALLAVALIVIALAALAAFSSVFGADSRDGFANERLRSSLS